MNGQSVATLPTAAAAPVATNRKSRRVGWSAEDAVVTIPTLSFMRPVEPPRGAPKTSPEQAAGARDPPRRQNDAFFTPKGRNQQSRIVLLAPLPGERKPAIGAEACNARIPWPA